MGILTAEDPHGSRDTAEGATVPCGVCRGACCALDLREGTVRYALLRPHGEGVHWCRACSDGTAADWGG